MIISKVNMKQLNVSRNPDTQSSGLRIVLCTLNSKYSHTSLSLRLLRQAIRQVLPEADLVLAEYTINDQPDQLLRKLHELNGDIYAFSCYIWNAVLTTRLVKELGIIRPDARIILGGPEAAWQQEEMLREIASVDYILAGEGETNLPLLLLNMLSGSIDNSTVVCSNLSGLAWRDSDSKIIINPVSSLLTDGDWPFAYEDDELLSLKDRLLYYESSRGCPFGCTYCMSSRDRRVRYRDLDTVFQELDKFIAADVKLVKFVDRTFNCDPVRALKIWRYLLDKYEQQPYTTGFHFEIAADLINEEALNLFRRVPSGLFQLEIGVQSCDQEVLSAINRACNLDRLEHNVQELRINSRMHLHLDLIAGLPGENHEQFIAGFNQVIELRPHMLQLGFLKILPGSIIRSQAADYGLAWRHEPPYEVLYSDKMSFEELQKLKRVEHQLDVYYNSSSFSLSISYLMQAAKSVYGLFQLLADIYYREGWEDRAISRQNMWSLPMLLTNPKYQEYSQIVFRQKIDEGVLRDCLVLDYIAAGQKDQPSWQLPLELSDLENDKKLTDLIRIRHRQEYPASRRIRLERFKTNPPEMMKMRQEILAKGHTDWTSVIDQSTVTISGWLMVFDMSGNVPHPLWQLNLAEDIQSVPISRFDDKI